MSDRYNVNVSFVIDVADIEAVKVAAPAIMRRISAEHGGIESDFVDNTDQAAAYVGLDPQYAMNLVMYDAVLEAIGGGAFAGSGWDALHVNCTRA